MWYLEKPSEKDLNAYKALFYDKIQKKIEKKSAVSVFDGNGAFICAYAGGYFWLVLLIRLFDIYLCLFLQAGNFMRSVYLPGT